MTQDSTSPTGQRGANPRLPRRVLLLLGNSVFVLGVFILLVVGILYLYTSLEKGKTEEDLRNRPRTLVATEVAASAPTQESASPTTIAIVPGTASPKAAPTRTVAPLPTPTPFVGAAPLKMVMPSIELDSDVVEAPLVNGEWLVPKFVVGHLTGTAFPGAIGNSVYTGHVDSINAGNVFASLDKARVGDLLYLYDETTRFTFRVSDVRVVPNNDLEVIQPTKYPVVTLITCTGTWIASARDFSHRLIVVGDLLATSDALM